MEPAAPTALQPEVQEATQSAAQAAVEAALQQALERLWSSNRPGLSTSGDETVVRFIREAGIVLPATFTSYLRTYSPEENWWDDQGIVWWAPTRLRLLTQEELCIPDCYKNPAIWSEADKYVIFADYLDRCYDYAICCSESENRGKVALVGHCPNRFVASDFLSFTGLVAANSNRLHSPIGDGYTDLV